MHNRPSRNYSRWNTVARLSAGRPSQVQREVKENTWQAFWLSTIDDLPAAEVARQLKISVGSVYIARSRVMARLRRLVKSATDE